MNPTNSMSGTTWLPQDLDADDPLRGDPSDPEVLELLRQLRDPFRLDPDRTTRKEA